MGVRVQAVLEEEAVRRIALLRKTPLKRGGWTKRKTGPKKSSGWRIKVDPNDALYSKIIRFGHPQCARCGKIPKALQCAHIMGRARHSTRFMLRPVRNAIQLCGGPFNSCHHFFDTHKMFPLLMDPAKRVFTADEESFTFLVERCGYTWEQLELLYKLRLRPAKYGRLEFLATKQALEADYAAIQKLPPFPLGGGLPVLT